MDKTVNIRMSRNENLFVIFYGRIIAAILFILITFRKII